MNNSGSPVKDFLIVVGVMYLLGFTFFMVRGIQVGSHVPYMILAVLVFVVIAAVVTWFILFIQAQTRKNRVQDAEIEQAKFRDNTVENLETMRLLLNAQTAQSKALSAHQSALARALPAPSGAEQPIDALVFEDEVFDGLS